MTPSPDEKLMSDPRQRLLAAAEEIFAAKGYEGASVRDICSLAGMNVAAVNYHFGDKQQLYIEAVKHAHSCSMSEAAPPNWEPGVPPKEKLRQYIQMMVRAMHGPIRPAALQLVMRELTNPSPATEAVVREYIQPMAYGLREIIWELFPHLPETQCIMIGFSIVGQCLYYRQNRQVSLMLFGEDHINALDLETVTAHITRFTLAALGLGKPYRDPKEGS